MKIEAPPEVVTYSTHAAAEEIAVDLAAGVAVALVVLRAAAGAAVVVLGFALACVAASTARISLPFREIFVPKDSHPVLESSYFVSFLYYLSLLFVVGMICFYFLLLVSSLLFLLSWPRR